MRDTLALEEHVSTGAMNALFRVTHRISGAVMWTNLHRLFWLSVSPVATKWVGQAHEASLPASVYGIVSFAAAVAYGLVTRPTDRRR